jgi:hypothetical protein
MKVGRFFVLMLKLVLKKELQLRSRLQNMNENDMITILMRC